MFSRLLSTVGIVTLCMLVVGCPSNQREAEVRAAQAKRVAERDAEDAAVAKAEKAVADKLAAAKAAVEKAAADKIAAEKAVADELAAAEKAIADKVAAEKKAAEERVAAEKKAFEERVAAEKKAAEERVAAANKAAEERAAKEKKAAEERAAKEKTDAGLLQNNTWWLVGVHAGGKEVDFNTLRPFNIRFTFNADGSFANTSTSKVQRGKYTIDPTKSPKEMDTMVDGKNGKGIYKLENGELFYCLNATLDQRPKEFDYKAEALTIMRFKKIAR